ncbi:hypothetical protein LSH36_260g01003 [Paralvinella palmiformis]|uniref:Nucleoporin Nup43 n=1 Tax=Paralvinella palmiformis TaxID=53620 RepID=A0AAD9JK48_9ANNE|nr:hypothetical protein LSH36_260g01003 [Paralvinella palmiformis]
MAESSSFAKFVSEKISKIRWQPTPTQAIRKSGIFATGSWDNGDDNRICIWNIEDVPPTEDISMDAYMNEQLDAEIEPTLLCEHHHRGDVTDLVMLSVTQTWEKLHHFPVNTCSCTGIAVKADDTYVTVGEDGRINLLHPGHNVPVRTIDEADNCTLNAVTFLKQSEAATVNSIGQLKVWDLRQTTDKPSQIFLMTGERVPLHCIDKHPTQPHIVATGGEDGTLCIWDMRQDKFPVTLLSAHSADMWELKFHTTHPDNLFSCSEDGSVWHWDRSAASAYSNVPNLIAQKDASLFGKSPFSSSLLTPAASKIPTVSSPWLSSEASKQCLDITDLMTGNTMPVNTLDIVDTTLLCGTDGGQIYTVKNLIIK